MLSISRIHPPHRRIRLPDVSIEQVASHAQQNTLPSPTLDIASIQAATLNSTATRLPTSPTPAYVETDPWSTPSTIAQQQQQAGLNGNGILHGIGGFGAVSGGGAPTTISGGLGKDWWKRQEAISISILPEKQGFLLNRFTVYLVESDVSIRTRTYSTIRRTGTCI